MNEQTNQTASLEKDAERILKAEQEKEKILAVEEEGYDGFSDSKIKLIPTPRFTEAKSVGTMLPINMANETVTNLTLLAQEFDFIDFIKDKLGYSSRIKVVQCFASEQIDALVLAIKSFEKNNAFILGDFAGVGKGRICAGVLRYAYMQGFIPVFMTQKPYLLNDIYRDLRNIDGIGTNRKGQVVAPKPFVMHNEGVIVDRDGNPIPTAQAYKSTDKNGELIFRFLDKGSPDSINELCRTMTDAIERSKDEPKLSKEFNCVMLPYSVISQSRSLLRKNFLSAIAPNSILIFDESHNAASANVSSNILKSTIPLVEASRAALFSSATYAKNPNVFNLYVVKTALRTAVPLMDAIIDALKVGGENVSEYIGSGLVKEGQMIRRERSFGDCKKITEYVGTIRRDDSFGNTIYSDISGDTQRAFYDEAIGYFKDLRDFSKSPMCEMAVDTAVMRGVSSMGKRLADIKEYTDALRAKKDEAEQVRAEFIRANRNKYIVTYSRDNISRYKATFRENLFLAVKAKFSADKIIDCLNTPVQYKNTDDTIHIAPQKPIIAMANTGEAIFNELRLEEGQEVKNDFSEYLRAVYNKMFIGNFKLRKIDANIFERLATLEASGIDYEILEGEYNVQLSDFADGGARVTEIQNSLNSYVSELPFSVIDYLRDRIENEARSPIYFGGANNAPLYGQASSPYYRFSEATSRSYMLKRDENGILRYQKNDRLKSTTKVFRGFNNGAIDVMLINVVASTGGSAQSSPDEGVDTRPRNMFIVQFELDVNVEVQKRGRINRTGQINSPTYTYIISKIPVELRKYLMFRKKLRKLDANTSADQTSSSKTSEITDAKGNPIEDIFNAYGFEVFKNDFIDLPDNIAYNEIFENMGWRSKTTVTDDDTAEADEMKDEQFNMFVRELELYPAQFQEYFFDEMNEKYIQKKALLIAQGEYQEELQAQNYKASLKQRVVIQLNSGSTVFSLPLFLSDYYTLESKRAWSKDRVTQKANELAVWDGKSVTPTEFYANFVEDYLRESKKAEELLKQELEKTERPIALDYPDTPEGKDKFNLALYMYDARIASRIRKQKEEITITKNYLSYFKPFTKVSYEGNLGMFIGYKIKKAQTKFKYTDGNIEFIFCFLSKYPVLHLKLSSNPEELKYVMTNSQLLLSGKSKQNDEDINKINDWTPDLNKRQVRRFMAGNILSGIVEANNRKKGGEFKSWTLSRFTNIDGSISTAIELKYEFDLRESSQINVVGQQLAVAADNANMLSYISDIPESYGYSSSEGRGQDIYPIWNLEGNNICDRAVCIVHRKNERRNPNGTYENIDTVEFEVIQSYIIQDKGKSAEKEKQRKAGEALYNNLYHDLQFQEMFASHLISKTPDKRNIKYAKITTRKKEGWTTKYNDFKSYIKTYRFNLADTQSIQYFTNELYKKYEISFNFRSDVAAYFNIETQGDTFDATKKQIVRTFPEGEYQYRFIRQVSDITVEAIPNLLRRTFDGVYGAVFLSQPLIPNMLPSFEMKPYKINAEVYVKLALAVLNDEDKTKFVKELEELAEVKNEDAYTIGEHVRDFLTSRSVGTIYFFGDLRVSEYGLIFREFALKQDLERIVFEDREDDYIEPKPVKTQISLEDAENFIIKLWSLI
jgi:hypothetical protein